MSKFILLISCIVISSAIDPFLSKLSNSIIDDFKQSYSLLDHNHDSLVTILEASVGILSQKQYLVDDSSIISMKPVIEASASSSSLSSSLSLQSYASKINSPSYKSNKCINAVPDGPVFVDCVVENARLIMKDNPNMENFALDLNDQISKYFESSSCDDIVPVNEKNITCYDLVGINRIETPSIIEMTNKLIHNHKFEHTFQDFNNINIDIDRNSLCTILSTDNFCRLSCRKCISMDNLEVECDSTKELQSVGDDESYIPVLISSDWHTEPWYDASVSATVARYSSPTIENMWECFDESNTTDPIVECNLNGISDPPVDFIESHFQGYQLIMDSMLKNSNKYRNNNSSLISGLLFFSGDTQVHDYNSPDIGTCDEATAIGDLMSRVLSIMTSYWDADNIFMCPGNNDGPHNSIFSSTEDETIYNDSQAWAKAVINAGIVNNNLNYTYDYATSISTDGTVLTSTILSQIDFFQSTGYFIKQVDPNNIYGLQAANLFAISYNTNLGSTNQAQQSALLTDLNRIQELGGGVYVLGHHPDITIGLIPDDYKSLVKGMFSGHIHIAASTTRSLFTQVSAISQAATDTAFYVGKIKQSNEYQIKVKRVGDLVFYDNSNGAGKLADPSLWQYKY